MDKKAMMVIQEDREEEGTPIHGDLLELILTFVPLIHLLSVCRVSRSWRNAVFSSLTNFNKMKPWLFVHTQSNYSRKSRATHAYDPRSNTWIEIQKPSIKYVTTLRSSGSNFLYVFSSSQLDCSDDPFYLSWRRIKGARVYRDNPIVARCGTRIVVAGSCWDFENDPLAVEVYDSDSSTWTTSQSMPGNLKNADGGATWLSVASNRNGLIAMEKATGISYSFDPLVGEWCGPYVLRSDPRAYFSTVGFAGEDLIVASLIGESGKVEKLRISKVNSETMGCEPICDAPKAIVEKLKGNKTILEQIEVSLAKDFVYIYNSQEPEEVVFCDFSGDGGDCVWRSTPNVGWTLDVKIAETMVFTCGRVEIEDLDEVMRSGNLKFR